MARQESPDCNRGSPAPQRWVVPKIGWLRIPSAPHHFPVAPLPSPLASPHDPVTVPPQSPGAPTRAGAALCNPVGAGGAAPRPTGFSTPPRWRRPSTPPGRTTRRPGAPARRRSAGPDRRTRRAAPRGAAAAPPAPPDGPSGRPGLSNRYRTCIHGRRGRTGEAGVSGGVSGGGRDAGGQGAYACADVRQQVVAEAVGPALPRW